MSHAKGKTDEEGFESRDFQELEQEFKAVLREIGSDRELEHFRREYEKLYEALNKSHENEKTLIKKCKELNSNITESTTKVQQAIRLSQIENENIRAFQTDLDQAVKTLETFKEKEDRAKQTIQSLREEIDHLGQIVEQGSGLAVGQDSTVNELVRAKEELTREVEIGNEHIISAQQEQRTTQDKIANLDSGRENHEQEVKHLNVQISELKEKMNKEVVRKHEIEQQLNEEKRKFEGIISELSGKDKEIQELQNLKHEVSRELSREEDNKQEKVVGMSQAEKDRKSKEDEVAERETARNTILKTIRSTEEKIKKTRDKIRVSVEEREALQNELNSLSRKQTQLTLERKQAEALKNQSKDYTQTLIKESEELRRNTEADRALLENLKRERDMVMKTVLRSKDSLRLQSDTAITMDNNQKKLENEFKKYTKEIKKLKHDVWQLQKEQQRYGVEKSNAYAKYSQCLEEVKLCNSVIAELQKKNSEVETKLKQQQSLYEAVRTDRNLYSKNLRESKEEITELEKKKAILIQQISQTKEDINLQDKELLRETEKNWVLEKRREEFGVYNTKSEDKKTELDVVIKRSETDIQRLKYVISEVEQEKVKQKKELELVTNERNILSDQLIKRKTELELLYEKINIYSSTLSKGKEQYHIRITEITQKKNDIAAFKQNLLLVKKEADTVFDLKREQYFLQKEALDEKIKVKALTEEVENTLNVHRWRKLEGTDPESYELITKIQTLQKRLIGKTEEVLHKGLGLETLEKEYSLLRQALSRQPGPESQEKIEECQRILDEKRAQMKNMEEELRLYQAQADQYKFEIKRLTKELQDVKKNFFELKKKEQLLRDRQLKAEGRDQIQRNPPLQRFTGGGFNLAI